jgi:hypothetical protein
MTKPLTIKELVDAKNKKNFVKFTSKFLDHVKKRCASSMYSRIKNKLEILCVDIHEYNNVYITVESNGPLTIPEIDENGFFKGVPVFDSLEYYCHLDDRCNRCGHAGKRIRTACVCTCCGNVIWGF